MDYSASTPCVITSCTTAAISEAALVRPRHSIWWDPLLHININSIWKCSTFNVLLSVNNNTDINRKWKWKMLFFYWGSWRNCTLSLIYFDLWWLIAINHKSNDHSLCLTVAWLVADWCLFGLQTTSQAPVKHWLVLDWCLIGADSEVQFSTIGLSIKLLIKLEV